MEEFLKIGSFALLAGLILITAYVLYQRLLKTIAHGKYEDGFTEIQDFTIDREKEEITLSLFLKRKDQVTLQILDSNKKFVYESIHSEFQLGEQIVVIPFKGFESGKYTAKIDSNGQSVTKYFSVR